MKFVRGLILILIYATLALPFLAQSQTIFTKGFTWGDYQQSLETGSTMTPVDMVLPENIAQHLLGPDINTNPDQAPISYIIGGRNSARGEFREFALVLITDNTGNLIGACGGTLIARNKVLTAAHCSQESSSRYFVLPGFYSFNDRVTAADFIRTTRVADHPQYRNSELDYDIGILTLERAVSNPRAKLHAGNNKFVDKTGTVIGTGLTSTQPPAGLPILQKVSAPIRSNSDCNDIWDSFGAGRPITYRMVCAGFTSNGDGSCSGDSGGPLFRQIDGQRVVIGTVSFGLRACEFNRGNQAYARISSMVGFIRNESPETEFVTSSDTLPIGALMMLLDEEKEPEPPEPDLMFPPLPEEIEGKYVFNLGSRGSHSYDTFTQLSANLSVTEIEDNAIQISFSGYDPNNPFMTRELSRRIIMSKPVGEGRLELGDYTDILEYPYHGTNAGFSIEQSSSCSTTSGRFRIFELEYQGDEIIKLVADFIQYCYGQTEPDDAIKGSIYYDASKSDAQLPNLEPGSTPEFLALPELNYAGAALKLISQSDQGTNQNYMLDDSNTTFSVTSEYEQGELAQNLIINAESSDISIQILANRGSLRIDPERENPMDRGIYWPSLSRGVPIGRLVAPEFNLRIGPISVACAKSSRTQLNIITLERDSSGLVTKLEMEFQQKCIKFNATLDSRYEVKSTRKGSFVYDINLPARPNSI